MTRPLNGVRIPLTDLHATAIGPRALVTGGGGYLGRHLVDALRALGCSVRTLDLVPSPRDDVDSIVGDVRDAETVDRACRDVDVIFHAAAAMSFLWIAPRATRRRIHDVNVEGTRHVLDAARRHGVRRLVYTSSANVVIDRELVEVGEEAPYPERFEDLYGATKAEAERLVLAANDPDGLRTCAVRPGGIWGGGDGGLMIRAFLENVAKGAFVATIGSGEAVVDNTHVDTLVYAELLAAQRLTDAADVVGGRPYFVTDDERVNGITWFRPILDGLGMPWPRWRLPGRLMLGAAVLGEAAHLVGAPEPTLTRIGILKLTRSSAFRVDAARRDLGWDVLVKHREGIASHLPDYTRLLEDLRAR